MKSVKLLGFAKNFALNPDMVEVSFDKTYTKLSLLKIGST